VVAAALTKAIAQRREALVGESAARNANWFDVEMEKLDHWAEDRRASLKTELSDLDDALKEAKKLARVAPTLPERLERQRAVRTLEDKREHAWKAYDAAGREIDRQKDAVLDQISRQLEQKIDEQPLFTLRWTLT